MYNMRVKDAGNGPRLNAKPRDVVFFEHGAAAHHFQSDRPVEPDLYRLVDDAHAADGNALQNSVSWNGGKRGSIFLLHVDVKVGAIVKDCVDPPAKAGKTLLELFDQSVAGPE